MPVFFYSLRRVGVRIESKLCPHKTANVFNFFSKYYSILRFHAFLFSSAWPTTSYFSCIKKSLYPFYFFAYPPKNKYIKDDCFLRRYQHLERSILNCSDGRKRKKTEERKWYNNKLIDPFLLRFPFFTQYQKCHFRFPLSTSYVLPYVLCYIE